VNVYVYIQEGKGFACPKPVLLIFLVFCPVLLCFFTFWVPYCDVCYDFHLKMMFGSSLPPVVCRRAHVLFMLFVFVCHSGVQHILCCVFVMFFLVLCTLCCQFLWIVHFWLPLRYSLMFISNTIYMSWPFFVFDDLRYEVGVHFADIDRIVDHHCLRFLFIKYNNENLM
jgi:hypothetical protein